MPEVDFRWATDANHPAGSDPWNGQPNKVKPSLGRQQTGFMPDETVSSEVLNYIFHAVTEVARVIRRNNAFVGDCFIPMDLAAATDFDACFKLDLADTVTMPHVALAGPNVLDSIDGWDWSAGSAHSVTGSTAIASGISGTQRTIVVGANGVGRMLGLAAMTGAGHTETFSDVCSHYREVAGVLEFYGFIAVAENGRINRWGCQTSPLVWTGALSLGATRDYGSIVSRNGVLIAGYQSGISISFDDGASWTHQPLTTVGGFYTAEWAEAADNELGFGVWIAQGNAATYRSMDGGATWVDVSASVSTVTKTGVVNTTSGIASKIVCDGQRFYLPGRWSEDGISWFETFHWDGTPPTLCAIMPPAGIGGGYVILRHPSGPRFLRTQQIRTSVSPL